MLAAYLSEVRCLFSSSAARDKDNPVTDVSRIEGFSCDLFNINMIILEILEILDEHYYSIPTYIRILLTRPVLLTSVRADTDDEDGGPVIV